MRLLKKGKKKEDGVVESGSKNITPLSFHVISTEENSAAARQPKGSIDCSPNYSNGDVETTVSSTGEKQGHKPKQRLNWKCWKRESKEKKTFEEGDASLILRTASRLREMVQYLEKAVREKDAKIEELQKQVTENKVLKERCDELQQQLVTEKETHWQFRKLSSVEWRNGWKDPDFLACEKKRLSSVVVEQDKMIRCKRMHLNLLRLRCTQLKSEINACKETEKGLKVQNELYANYFIHTTHCSCNERESTATRCVQNGMSRREEFTTQVAMTKLELAALKTCINGLEDNLENVMKCLRE